MTQFQKLFEPISVGSMELKNRIVFPPIGTRFASVTGEVTQYDIDHYRVRASGGASLLIVPWVLVDVSTQTKTGRHRLDSVEYIRGMNEVVNAVHREGAKIAIQLSHGGRAVTSDEIVKGKQAVAPSDAYCPPFKTHARALTVEEIVDLEDKFAAAVLRAKQAGFDAVEYHAASGYLLSQFLSPFVNKRQDKYGGTAEKRLTFLTEIIEKSRTLVGDGYPQMVRISGDEFVEGGLNLEDNKFIAMRLEDVGVSCVDVTMGIVESYHKAMPPMAVPPAAYIYLAEGIKKVVNIPVIGVGRINEPVLANQILEEGKADLVAMGRALLADPDLPNKALMGMIDDIKPCIYCNRCEMATSDNVHIKCAVNPNLGHENEFAIKETTHPKNVVVIGGGVAGITASLIASQRGHKVTLYEKESILGGQLILSSAPPHKEELKRLLKYLTSKIGKSKVDVKLGEEATPKKIFENHPDIIIVATGAKQIVPDILGIENSKVIYAWDVLKGEANIKNRVVVVGGGMVGCETAELIATMNREVDIVEMLDDVGIDMEPFTKVFLLDRLGEHGVKIHKSSFVTSITDEGVETINKNWRRQTIESDSVVIAVGSSSNREIYDKLRGKVEEIYNVGDSSKPSRILEAIHDATNIACKI